MFIRFLSVKLVMVVVAILSLSGANSVLAEAGAGGEAAADFAKACAREVDNVTRDPATRKDLNSKYKAMRSACAGFRECKRTCRKDRKNCKGDARADKAQCLAGCSRLADNRERKACKKECRGGKKAAKNSCKKNSRSCADQCRSSLLSQECKSARAAFWNAAGRTAETALRACASEYPK